MEPSRWWIMSIRAAFLESEPTWYHGAVGVSVWTIISSLAREYSSHLVMDSRSMGESFHWRSGSFRRFWRGSGTSLTPAPCGDFLAMVQRIPAATRRGAGSDGIARRPEQRLTPPMTATPHGGPPRPAAPAGEYCDASLAHLLDLVTEN